MQEAFDQASDNLKFLSLLKDPCQSLQKAMPSKLPSLLPKILQIVRIIWINSNHYNTTELVTILLRKVRGTILVKQNKPTTFCVKNLDWDRDTNILGSWASHNSMSFL